MLVRLIGRVVVVSVLAAACIASAIAADPPAAAATSAGADAQGTYTPTPDNLTARHWFQDAKFGVFLHWGLYSELGGAGKEGIAEWIMNDNQIPARHYERLAKFFNPKTPGLRGSVPASSGTNPQPRTS